MERFLKKLTMTFKMNRLFVYNRTTGEVNTLDLETIPNICCINQY